MAGWGGLLPRRGPAVHPAGPLAPRFSEFVAVGPRLRVRVIRLLPADLRDSFRLSCRLLTMRLATAKTTTTTTTTTASPADEDADTDDYWFSKWSQEAASTRCRCSFRKSLRRCGAHGSGLALQADGTCVRTEQLQSPSSNESNVEIFVEKLILDAISEALQEYYISSIHKGCNGTINLSYQNTEMNDCNKRLEEADSIDLNIVSALLNKNKIQDQTNNENSPVCLRAQSRQKLSGCIHTKTFRTRPLLMFFHGIGGSADIWWLVMNHMINKGYEVVAPDLLGHGYSTAPDIGSFYTFHNLLIQALALFDHYVLPESKRKCILIGHSYGCSIATGVYSHRPMHISQLILISGGGPNPLAAPSKTDCMSSLACLHTLFHPLLWCGVKRSWFYASRGKHFQKTNPDCALPKHVLYHLVNGQNWPEGDAAFHRRILVPTLLVHGLLDEEITLVQECEMERTIPRSFLELIPNAAHMPMLETPEQLSHMILCFISSWT